MELRAQAPLGKAGKIGLAAFVLLLIVFGGLVEQRSAFLTRRMGDLDVFLRAAWAVRADADLYGVTSDNDWHYLYPPLYAILLTPLADPPRGQDHAGYLPYAWSVAIIYVVSLMFLFWGAHVLASALEERADDARFRSQPAYCMRWWALRLWPTLVCLMPIGHTLSRGQVNLMVLAFLCAALAGWIRGRNFRAGAWLGLAICIKVIPVYLLVYPLWKRDGRALLGCAASLLLGLAVIPAIVFGPEKAVTHYETYARVFFAPFFKLNNETALDDEILGSVNASPSVGVKNALFNWAYPDPGQRPKEMPALGNYAYLALGIAMTLLTLWPGTLARAASPGATGRQDDARPLGASFAALILLMAIFSPVCHPHYLTFCLPLITCILFSQWQFQVTLHLPRMLILVFAGFFVTTAVAYLPSLEILQDRCAALFTTLLLWIIPVTQLWRGMPNAATLRETGEARELTSAA
jgi:alpha-1,2-mannosyltransferase